MKKQEYETCAMICREARKQMVGYGLGVAGGLCGNVEQAAAQDEHYRLCGAVLERLQRIVGARGECWGTGYSFVLGSPYSSAGYRKRLAALTLAARYFADKARPKARKAKPKTHKRAAA